MPGASSCSERPAGSDGRRPRRLARDGFVGGGRVRVGGVQETLRGRIWGGGQEAPRSRRAATRRRTVLREAGLAEGAGRDELGNSCGNVYWADFSPPFFRARP